MNTTNNRKKSVIAAVGAAVAAAAAPALLFAGAGTAQAYTGVNLTPDPSAPGVWVHVNSVGLCLIGADPHNLGLDPKWTCSDDPEAVELGKAHISSGWCTYKAEAPGFLPATKEFHLDPGGKADLWFDGIPTGTTWNVTIHCPNGTDSATQQVVY